MALPNTLRNSNYTQKHIVDADQIMENLQYVLDQIGETPLKNLIIATGQPYNKLNAQQLITAIVQLILTGQYFTDKSTSVNEIVLTPVVSSYSTPSSYINNMEFVFTPSHTNTAGVSILFDGLDSVAYTKSLLDKAGNELTAASVVANNTYCAHYDSLRDAFILGSLRDSSSNTYSEASLSFIEDVVESLGITFSSTNVSQLVKAIAEYSLMSSYKDVSTSVDLNNQIYRIKPFNEEGSSATTLAYPFEYYNGMTIRFTPSFDNTSSGVSIVIDTLSPVALKRMDGSNIRAADIRQGIDIVVRYFNGLFYLVSDKLNKLSLYRGESVDGIDSVLTSDATSIPTSFAVKTALDNSIFGIKNALVGNKAFCVVGSESQPYITLDANEVTLQPQVGLVFEDYSYKLIEEAQTLDLTGVTGNFKILYIKNGGLACIGEDHYTESFVAPSAAGTDGDAYVYINSNGKITTSIYDSALDNWIETSFVKIAFGSESSGSFTLTPIPLNGKFISETTSIPTSSNSTIITHNMDSLCNIKASLLCTDADLAYDTGDSIILNSFITSNDFTTLGTTSTQAVISTSGILLPNSGGTPSAITPSKWKLLLHIERAF